MFNKLKPSKEKRARSVHHSIKIARPRAPGTTNPWLPFAMRKPASCALLSPSSWTSSSSAAFSSVSSAASTSSTGTCYAPPPSWAPRQQYVRKGKRSKCTRAKNAGAGGAVAVPRTNSSIYRGVTRHKSSGKFEAHLWDKHSWNPTSASKKKGKQVYLGAYESQEAAARTYDLAALKYWGSRSVLNFPLESYKQERVEMQRMTREGYLATLRRRSNGFSRGASQYRGVSKHHHNGRWEARIGHGHAGSNKYIYLGTFGRQEEAARAYDLAALEFRGHSAVTNFDSSSYLQLQPRPVVLQPKDEPTAEAPLSRAQPTPLLQPKPEPEDEHGGPVALPLLDADDDVDHAIAEILPALCMDPADFEAMYSARHALAPGCVQTDDLLRGLPLRLPDTVRFFEDDIEALFDDAAPGFGAVPGEADAVSYTAATTISSLASGGWP